MNDEKKLTRYQKSLLLLMLIMVVGFTAAYIARSAGTESQEDTVSEDQSSYFGEEDEEYLDVDAIISGEDTEYDGVIYVTGEGQDDEYSEDEESGQVGMWFLGTFICIANVIYILFADQLFYLRYAIRFETDADFGPSDFEIGSRYVGWTVLVIVAFVAYCMGLPG